MPRKADIKLVDRVVKEFHLSKGQRRLLHGEIQRSKIGRDLIPEKIRELAAEIVKLYPNK